ncbi:MAG: DUF4125 family protein [Eubacterium sp.]|nr:DUF4125 family protein [Eubacterium sp.]
MRKALIQEICEKEYTLFQKVRNEGTRAACQDRRDTFFIMRSAQFQVWSTESLASWRQDLEDAVAKGRNPLADKYGYMMASTYPEGYEGIRRFLPEVGKEKQRLAEQYLRQYLKWAEESQLAHPHFRGQGRPLYTVQDTEEKTSLETYLRGELYTYSEATLKKLLQDCEKAREAGCNLVMEIDDATARAYGYPSAGDYV